MPFDMQPTLSGELVRLRPLRADDFAGLYAVAADPLIWEQHPSKHRYQRNVFEDVFREALESGGTLVASDCTNGKIIGSSRYFGYDEATREVEIGWTFLARSHWGGVYNGEMKRLMLLHAFKYVSRVVFLVDEQNFRSQKAIERIGGIHAGSRRTTDGRDRLLFEITAPR
jgi:N-acetyltransferase